MSPHERAILCHISQVLSPSVHSCGACESQRCRQAGCEETCSDVTAQDVNEFALRFTEIVHHVDLFPCSHFQALFISAHTWTTNVTLIMHILCSNELGYLIPDSLHWVVLAVSSLCHLVETFMNSWDILVLVTDNSFISPVFKRATFPLYVAMPVK